MVISGIAYAENGEYYIYQIDSGQLGQKEQRQDKSLDKVFTSQDDLEKYLHGFGEWSRQLKLKEINNRLTYEIPEDARVQGRIGGEILYNLYGLAPDKRLPGKEALSPEEALRKYANCNKSLPMVQHCKVEAVTQISPNWKYIGSRPSDDNTFYYEYFAEYAVDWSYTRGIDQIKGNKRTTEFVYKYVEFDCSQDDDEKLLKRHGLYFPEDVESGKCKLWNYPIEVWRTSIPYNENKSCKVSADPVDLSSGDLYEEFTDAVVHSPNPIVIKRYYSTKSFWTLSFSRRIQREEGSVERITAIRDDGSQYLFIRVGPEYIARDGFNGTLNYVANNNETPYYELRMPNGDIETYLALPDSNKFSLRKIVTPKGYTTTLTPVDGKAAIDIDDGFGHVVRLENNKGANQEFLIRLPNNQVVVYRYTQGNLTSVRYPSGRSVQYQYQSIASSRNPILNQIQDAYSQMISAWLYNKDNRVASNNIYR
ncbi:DUF6531 domain-containing protein [Caedibacter taeniospiralis]|uniref:DUF6531 domain-containing protein n=1 Tax=Caedibacter taeniospiralis TaxID=28907 RepID=UPI000C26FF63|nr:DUF6531 domain-containing protein [Caedibacter taeniospiralis]